MKACFTYCRKECTDCSHLSKGIKFIFKIILDLKISTYFKRLFYFKKNIKRAVSKSGNGP